MREPSEMTGDELLAETLALSEQRAQAFLTEQRKEQISVRINSLLFEWRYQNGEFSAQALV